jgi:acetyl esterase
VPLDPSAKRLLGMIASAGMADIACLSPQQMRDGFQRLTQAVGIRDVPVVAVEDGAWPGPGGALHYRLYRARPAAAPAPALIYFHGGGCIFGSIDTYDGLCRALAAESGCTVISFGYRQAPEHKFPAAVEDCLAATRWAFAQADALGIDRRRIAIGGDSGGAALATIACQTVAREAGPRPAFQLLLCPVLDLAAESASRQDFADGYFLTRATIEWMLGHYCPKGTDLADPRLSPLRAPDVAGLPPAHIHTAEFDPLRDEGAAYAARLEQAGVSVRITCHAGMIHHFYGMAGAIPQARAALREIAGALGDALGA